MFELLLIVTVIYFIGHTLYLVYEEMMLRGEDYAHGCICERRGFWILVDFECPVHGCLEGIDFTNARIYNTDKEQTAEGAENGKGSEIHSSSGL